MLGACDWPCLTAYFFSLTNDELRCAFVGLFIILPMLSTICHEAGHYYAAKLCGIDSEEFALGRGPALLRVRVTPSGCKFALRMFPVGGKVTYDDRYWQLSYAKRAFMSGGRLAGGCARRGYRHRIGLPDGRYRSDRDHRVRHDRSPRRRQPAARHERR